MEERNHCIFEWRWNGSLYHGWPVIATKLKLYHKWICRYWDGTMNVMILSIRLRLKQCFRRRSGLAWSCCFSLNTVHVQQWDDGDYESLMIHQVITRRKKKKSYHSLSYVDMLLCSNYGDMGWARCGSVVWLERMDRVKWNSWVVEMRRRMRWWAEVKA